MDLVKYFTHDKLVAANEAAIAANLNRSLTRSFLSGLDRHLKFPVTLSMPHNDDHMRVLFVVDNKGTTAAVDMSFEDYEALPVLGV